MPGAAAAVAAGSVIGSAVTTSVFVAIGTGTFASLVVANVIGAIITIGVGMAISTALGAIAGALTSKPKNPGSSPIASTSRERTLAVKQPISSHRIIFGEVRLSGVLTFVETTNGNDNLHELFTMAGHEMASFGEVYINGDPVTLSGNTINSGPFANQLNFYTGIGSVGGDSSLNTALIANTTGWTANHKQSGRAKMYLELIHDPDVFVGSTPAVTVRGRGLKLFDPRDSGTRYSNNPALCIYAYLTNTSFGLGEAAARINTTTFNAAANVCEEVVSVESTRTFTVDTGTDKLTLSSDAVGFKTGDICQLTTTGTLPAGLSLATDYFMIKVDADEIQLASSEALALAGTQIDITDAGSGIHTLTRQYKDTFTAATSDLITLPARMLGLTTGSGVEVSNSGGALPTGLSAATTYYYIRVTDTTGFLATTYANALAQTQIDITGGGTGTHTLHRTKETRYACNGTFQTNQEPLEILEQLLTSCHGMLVYQTGKWNLYVDYQAPTLSIDESDLDGPMQIQTLITKRELFNRVKGVFASEDHEFLATDFPAITNATYLAEDSGEEIFKDIDLPFTTSSGMAQRIAKIQLEQARQQSSVVLSCKLSALLHKAGDTVLVNNTRMGWSSKTFRVEEWKFATRGGDESPQLGIDMFCRENASAIYDWNGGEETRVDLSPNTTLPDPASVIAPTSLTLTSGNSTYFTKTDGTIVSRIKATWTDSTGSFAQQYDVQFKKDVDSIWESVPSVPPGTQLAFIWEVDEGVAYSVRVRLINVLGVASLFLTQTGHIVAGKTDNPDDVTNFSANQTGNLVNFMWDQVVNADLAGYEIRYALRGTFIWCDAIVITKVTKGTFVTNGAVPPGDWTLAIKARDNSENYSTNATTFDLVIENTNTIISAIEQHPRWPGTKSDCHVHDVSCSIVPNTTSLADDNNYDIFDEFAENSEPSFYYEAPEIDIGFDNTVRVFPDNLITSLAPAELGDSDPDFLLDFKLAAGAYDGFESFAGGNVTARFLKTRIEMDMTTGKASLRSFAPTVDIEARTESATGLTVAVAGTAVVFNSQFSVAPSIAVQVRATSALTPVISSISGTGFTIQVFNSSGTDVGGTVDWQATGA